MTEPNNHEARIVKIETRLDAIADRQDEVHHYLRGNGQPGLEARLRSETTAAVNTIVGKIDALQADVTTQKVSVGKIIGIIVGSGLFGAGVASLF